MLIKLSGDRYVNSEHIESIDPRVPSDGYSEHKQATAYTVHLVSGHTMSLTQVQFEELLSALPTLYDAESKRKRKAAQAIVQKQVGAAWYEMDEDARYDLVSEEVQRAGTQ